MEVLDLSRKHNFLILEGRPRYIYPLPHAIIFELIPSCTMTFRHTQDDPYYFMYFGASPRIASYFMLEAQTGDRSVGRVLRFDSFSKILSSGIRIGFVTGPTPLLDAIDRHVSSCTNQSIISISSAALP